MQFNVGDRVVCVDGFEVEFNGEVGTITHIRPSTITAFGTMFHVKFDCSKSEKEWRAIRFEHADPTIASLTPVCRKIRQMETRWNTFQTKKRAAK